MTTPASASTTASLPVPAKRTLRILYAEDVRQLRDLMMLVLTKEGHTVECEVDGLKALEKIKAGLANYDLLITDHHMPIMNGLELVTQVRALSFAGKIIIFSSELNSEVSQAYRQLKVDCLLPKPIFPDTLRAVLATL